MFPTRWSAAISRRASAPRSKRSSRAERRRGLVAPSSDGSNPTLEFAHGKLPDHQHAGLAVIEARNRGKVLPAVALERSRIVDRDLFQGFQTIGGKTRRDDHKILHAPLGQRLHCLDGVRLEPLRAAKTRLECHHELALIVSELLAQQI